MNNNINYRITGDGGDQRLISVTSQQYKYFSDKDHEFIKENALGSNSEVPSDLSLEEWSSVDAVHDISGFTFGSSQLEMNYNNVLVTISLSKTELQKAGASYEVKKINLNDFAAKNEKKYFLLGELKETGELKSEFQAQDSFDIKKLKISISDFNDWEIISAISYDGVIIDSVSEENEVVGEEFKILMI